MNPNACTSILDYINLIKLFPYPEFWGILLFFLVPLLLWIGCTLCIKSGEGKTYSIFAFIAGSDNRLSLSRLQAFMWTLVIFGSFVAAMAIHTKIPPWTETDINRAKTNAEITALVRDGYKGLYEKALKNFNDNPGNEGYRVAMEKAMAEYQVASNKADAAAAANRFSNWVNIPIELLALAGIAIGSGIFSSIISAVNSEEKSAEIEGITHLPFKDFEDKKKFPNSPDSQSDRLLQIQGIDFGKKSKVRLAKGKFLTTYAPVLYWDEETIVVDVPRDNYDTIVIDTENGKLCYYIDNAGSTKPRLGVARAFYEFADLFRDDKDPQNMALMKFQMFGWTVVAIVVYSWMFLYDLSDHITSLPIVPPAIVILTGLSQTGYLAGKGVSNIPPRDSDAGK